VELYETGYLELYNLKNDISESKDLSKEMKTKTTEMYKLLTNWRESIDAQMPVRKPGYIR
jgi:hypothetical protein